MDTLRWIERAAAWITVIFIAWRLYRLYRIRPTSDQPRCAKCNYIVRDLTSTVCPECGSNLLATGVVPPGVRPVHEGRFAASIIALIVLCSLSLAYLRVPLAHWRERDIQTEITYGLPVSLRIRITSKGWSPVLPPQVIQAKTKGPAGETSLRWDQRDRRWTASNASGALFRTALLRPDDIQKCLAVKTDPRVTADMADALNTCATLADTSFRATAIPMATLSAPGETDITRMPDGAGSSDSESTVFLGGYVPLLLAILWAVLLPKISGQGNRVLYYQHAAKILRATSEATPKQRTANEAPSTKAHPRAGGPPNE